MGGVDLLDNAVAIYQKIIKQKKWWWPHFTNCVAILMAEIWKVYQITNSEKSLIIEVPWNLFDQLFIAIYM